MMIFPRLARDVERQRTYLDSQLISFQTSSFFAKAETIPRLARFILPPANIFQKYRFPSDPPFLHIATIVSSVFVQDPLSASHAFQQLHFSVGSCSPRIQSYRRFEL